MNNKIVKPSILPGFMELLPEDQILFNNMVDTIRKSYENYGFIPVDTPDIEKSEVLLAKGGGDTEKQIYRFLKGDTDMSLRFDLTVPLARFVAMHYQYLTFPFRRYHIGKVHRGEKNQKGRFREFYQCDIDIIGNGKLSIINDAEIPSIIYHTFKELDFGSFTIHINNRKILNGFFDSLKIEDKTDVLRTIDKLDKIGMELVKEELLKLSLSEEAVSNILNFMSITGSNSSILDSLNDLKIDNELFNEGLNELSEVIKYIKAFEVPEENFTIDLKIARGLDYYTGTVYETILNGNEDIGSVCSGGRYDNLAGFYTNLSLPGVGISIGLSRLFYKLKEAGIIKGETATSSKVVVVPMEDNLSYSIGVANRLRENEIHTEIFFDNVKVVKKLNYANKLHIPYVIFIGSEEMESGYLTLKNMNSGEQSKLSIDEVIEKLR